MSLLISRYSQLSNHRKIPDVVLADAIRVVSTTSTCIFSLYVRMYIHRRFNLSASQCRNNNAFVIRLSWLALSHDGLHNRHEYPTGILYHKQMWRFEANARNTLLHINEYNIYILIIYIICDLYEDKIQKKNNINVSINKYRMRMKFWLYENENDDSLLYIVYLYINIHKKKNY